MGRPRGSGRRVLSRRCSRARALSRLPPCTSRRRRTSQVDDTIGELFATKLDHAGREDRAWKLPLHDAHAARNELPQHEHDSAGPKRSEAATSGACTPTADPYSSRRAAQVDSAPGQFVGQLWHGPGLVSERPSRLALAVFEPEHELAPRLVPEHEHAPRPVPQGHEQLILTLLIFDYLAHHDR